jgi:hypothetical protein
VLPRTPRYHFSAVGAGPPVAGDVPPPRTAAGTDVMARILDYLAAGAARPARRINFVAIPLTVALAIIFVFQGPAIAIRCKNLPAVVQNTLFFLPQTCFPYDGLVWDDPSEEGAVFDQATARTLGVLQWVLVAGALTYALRRFKLRVAVPAAILIVFLVAIFGSLLFEPFGMSVQLDGP